MKHKTAEDAEQVKYDNAKKTFNAKDVGLKADREALGKELFGSPAVGKKGDANYKAAEKGAYQLEREAN